MNSETEKHCEVHEYFRITAQLDGHTGPATVELICDNQKRDRERTDDGVIDLYAIRAYGKPTFGRWCLDVSRSGVPFYTEKYWYCPIFRITTFGRPVLEGDRIENSQCEVIGHMQATNQPSLFGVICSAFGIENPTN